MSRVRNTTQVSTGTLYLLRRLEALTETQEMVYKYERENGSSIAEALTIAERPDTTL